jgi:nucleoid-associated protein YgaU
MRAHPSGSNVTHVAPAPDAGPSAPRSQKQPSPSGSTPGNGGILVEAVAAAGVTRGASAGDRYTVRPGDSLWDIAEMKLGTTEARRIARYWPRIHRANRDVIGGDPNLIVPGQVLTLPPERP